MLSTNKIALMIFVFFLIGCGGKKMVEVGYIFREWTGQNQFILIEDEKLPIKFDRQSDEQAILYLKALNHSVLYANSNGDQIKLIGSIDTKARIFKLRTWFIKAPFNEIIITNPHELPHETKIIQRMFLTSDDFTTNSGSKLTDKNIDLKKFVR